VVALAAVLARQIAQGRMSRNADSGAEAVASDARARGSCCASTGTLVTPQSLPTSIYLEESGCELTAVGGRERVFFSQLVEQVEKLSSGGVVGLDVV
jgi:hypothetical protein